MKALFATCSLVLGATFLAQAQSPSPSPSGSPTATPAPMQNIWRCDLPGGTYEAVLSAIVSVSRHEYVVDGVARVVEVNVDTPGNMAVRFYYIEPVSAKAPGGIGQSALDRASELAKEVVERTGQDDAVWRKVVKSYPTTTHSHTVEYRVKSEEDLKKIFTSVQTAFETKRGSIFTLTE